MKEKPARSSATESAIAFDDQQFRDAFAREQAQRHQRAMIGVVLSGMQPGLLVEAARAAARNRCAKEQDAGTRAACMKDAERK